MPIPLDKFIRAIDFVFDSTFFTFNKVFYKQIFGTPMGSPLSSVLADIVMQDIEETVSLLPSRPLIF